MSYSIEAVEGIGPAHGKTLTAAGIKTTSQLLDACCAKKGRKAIAAATGLSERQLLTWTNHADLMRIGGIGPQFSELLEAAGVDTVKELRNRKPENLAAKMVRVNRAVVNRAVVNRAVLNRAVVNRAVVHGEKKLVRRVPAAAVVAKWVAEAKSLIPMMTY